MKVLHVSSALSWRGGEQQVAYLMEEIENAGHVQYLFCPKDSSLSEHARKKALTFKTFTKRGSIDLISASKLSKYARVKQVDLIHLHDSHAHNIAVLATSFFRLRKPLVLSRRVDFPLKSNYFAQWKYNHPAIKKILCVSANISKIIAPQIKDPSKIEVVHSGIKSTRFKYFDRAILKNQFGLKKGELIIANIAAVADHKDYFTFVNTAELLLKESIEAKFFIIGSDGGQLEEIKKYIADKGLSKKIFMTGYRNDIPQILPELDIFLFTSKLEGLGTSILDAFACKIPVVATRAGGIPEIVKHEETGLSAAIKDHHTLAAHVKRIINEPTLRTKLTSNAFHLLEEFSTKKTSEKTIAIYNTILENNIL